MFMDEPPTNIQKQPGYADKNVKAKIRVKLEKILKKEYIELVDIKFVNAIMNIIHVPKGDDIRMVIE